MRQMRFVFLGIVLFQFLACTTNQKGGTPDLVNNKIAKEELKIVVHNVSLADTNANYYLDDVKKATINYFVQKGYKTKGQIVNYELQESIVDFDTCFISQNKNYVIVKYFLKPVDLNGTCVLSEYALVSKKDDSIVLSNEQFLPDNFFIDSLKHNKIYGYLWDCNNHTQTIKSEIVLVNQ